MATIDVSSFQSESEPTVVTMAEGKPITLKPLMALGSEHDQMLLDLISELGALGLAGKDTEEGEEEKEGEVGIPLDQLGTILPMVTKLLIAAAPTKADATRLDKLPLMARFQILMGYMKDQDLGGLSPSES